MHLSNFSFLQCAARERQGTRMVQIRRILRNNTEGTPCGGRVGACGAFRWQRVGISGHVNDRLLKTPKLHYECSDVDKRCGDRLCSFVKFHRHTMIRRPLTLSPTNRCTKHPKSLKIQRLKFLLWKKPRFRCISLKYFPSL